MGKNLRSGRGGFTLLELLVIIAIVALLIALALPALRGVAAIRDTAVNLATMRQLGMATTLYTQDNNLCLPFYGVPGSPAEPLRINGRTIPGGGPLFFRNHTLYWASHVMPYLSSAPTVPDGHGHVLIEVGGEGSGRYRCRYWMTHTAFAAPEFWMTGERHESGLARGVRTTEFRHPARKVLLVDVVGLNSRLQPTTNAAQAGARVLYVDGSTHIAPRTPRSFDPGAGFGFVVFTPLLGMATEDGAWGLDDFEQ